MRLGAGIYSLYTAHVHYCTVGSRNVCTKLDILEENFHFLVCAQITMNIHLSQIVAPEQHMAEKDGDTL